MTSLRTICMLLILLSLASCGDQDTNSTSQAQQNFDPGMMQMPSEIDQLQTRLLANPNDYNLLSALADEYFESGRYLEAIRTYDAALTVNPMSADSLNDRGLAYFYVGDADSAVDSFDKAIALNPDYPNTWLSKGFVLISEGRYQEAIVPLNKVKELDPVGQLATEADKFLAIAAENALR